MKTCVCPTLLASSARMAGLAQGILLSPLLWGTACSPVEPGATAFSLLFQTEQRLIQPTAGWWPQGEVEGAGATTQAAQTLQLAQSCTAEEDGFRCIFGEAPSAEAGTLRLILGDTAESCADMPTSMASSAEPLEDAAAACPWPAVFVNASEISPSDLQSTFQAPPEEQRLPPTQLTLRWSQSGLPAQGLWVNVLEPQSGIRWSFSTDEAGHPIAAEGCALWTELGCTLPSGPAVWQTTLLTATGVLLQGAPTWSPASTVLEADCPDEDGDQHLWAGCGDPLGDCNDQDASIYPGAPEDLTDALDQDCDGHIPLDLDQDGYESVQTGGDDCDDDDPDTYPGAPEVPYDGIDQNCIPADDADVDLDGFDAFPSGPDCDDTDPDVYPGAPEDLQDEVDQDCDGFLQQDQDQDGYITWNLSDPRQSDCDDQNASAYPGAPDAIDDHKDLNCDGYADTLLRYAGIGTYNGEGLSRELVTFSTPRGLAMGLEGRLWLTDGSNNRIRWIDEQDRVYTRVGDGIARTLPDEGPTDPLTVSIHHPKALAFGPDGSLYLGDTYNYRIRVLRPDGLLETFAGTGNCSYSGDGGPALEAELASIEGLVVDSNGTVYFSDPDNHRVRKVRPDGIIETVAGTGQAGSSGDGGPASDAQLDHPMGLALDAEGALLIADANQHRIRKVSTEGVISTFAGTGSGTFNGDGLSPDATTLYGPTYLLYQASGALLVSDTKNNRIRKIFAGVVSTLTGDGTQKMPDGPMLATEAPFYQPAALVEGADGSLYLTSWGDRRIWTISTTGQLQVYAGMAVEGVTEDGALALDARFNGLTDIALDAHGNAYLPDRGTSLIYRVSPTGAVSIAAGSGGWGWSGDGGSALDAEFRGPYGLDIDSEGRIYVADNQNHCIRKIDELGIITTIAGNGTPGYSGDGGLATRAQLNQPTDVSVSSENNVYIADKYNHTIRVVFAATGKISTLAGNGQAGSGGDGGIAQNAQLSFPRSVLIDSTRRKLYISDLGNMRIRVIDMPTATITTCAGTGAGLQAEDGELATASPVYYPGYLAKDSQGRLIFSQAYRVRRVELDGTLRTLAGMTPYGFAGEDGPALEAAFYNPLGVAIGADDSLFVVDPDSYRAVVVKP